MVSRPGHLNLHTLGLSGPECSEWHILHGTAGTAADRTGRGKPLGRSGPDGVFGDEELLVFDGKRISGPSGHLILAGEIGKIGELACNWDK